MTPMMETEVLVDFYCSSRGPDVLEREFCHATFYENIGQNKHQIGLSVQAPNVGEAYRRAIDATNSTLAMIGVTSPSILGATVYYDEGYGEEDVTFA